MSPALVLLGYGSLAVFATWAVWRNYEARPVGLAVVCSFLASNAAHVLLEQGERPAAYTVCEAAVMAMAFLAHVSGGSRMMIAVVIVSAISVASNLAVSRYLVVTKAQINLWEVFTNACFVAECLLLSALGLIARVRSRAGARASRHVAAFHVGSATSAKAKR